MGTSHSYQQILSDSEKSHLLSSLRRIEVYDRKSSRFFSRKVEKKRNLLTIGELNLLSLKLFFFEKGEVISDSKLREYFFGSESITHHYNIEIIKNNSDALISLLERIQSEEYYDNIGEYSSSEKIRAFHYTTLKILILDLISSEFLKKKKWVEYTQRIYDISEYSKRCGEEGVTTEVREILAFIFRGIRIDFVNKIAINNEVLSHRREILKEVSLFDGVAQLLSEATSIQ